MSLKDKILIGYLIVIAAAGITAFITAHFQHRKRVRVSEAQMKEARKFWVTKFTGKTTSDGEDYLLVTDNPATIQMDRHGMNAERIPVIEVLPTPPALPETGDLVIAALKHCRMFIVDGTGYREKFEDEKAALKVQLDNVLELLTALQGPEGGV